MGTPNLLIILSTLVSLLFLLLIVSILQRRSLREQSAGLLIDYVIFSWPWVLGQLLLWLDSVFAPTTCYSHFILQCPFAGRVLFSFNPNIPTPRRADQSLVDYGPGLGDDGYCARGKLADVARSHLAR